MVRLKLLLIPAIFIYVISGEKCPRELAQDCACSLSGSRWHITCRGYDLVNITRYLPPNTAVFRYTAMELFINLGEVDFSRLTELTAFQIKDPIDYKILDRKISNMTGDPKVFSGLSKLQELRINVNWEMQELPNMLHGLDNLQILDFSNTRRVILDNLLTNLQALRNSTNIKVLNLWNMITMTRSPTLHLDLAKLLEPLSQSRLEELNIGYNALRSVSPGLIQYTPWLKRLIIRNNVLTPIVTSSLMTEVLLHKLIVEADFSEQGLRPASDFPQNLRKYNAHKTPSTLRLKEHNQTIIQTQTKDYEHKNPSFLSQEQFLSNVHRTPPQEHKDLARTNTTILQADAKHNLPPKLRNIVKKNSTCFKMMESDSCSIFSPECKEVRDLLTEYHSLFCYVLNVYFKWKFTDIHCDYIPPFSELIRPDCGACLVIPSLGNLRKLYLSNLNIYDFGLQFSEYRNRPNCFYPNTSLEYVDYTGSAVHGYSQLYRFISAETNGLENLKGLNISGNHLTVLYPAIGSKFPRLQVLNASHNLITMADARQFVNVTKFIEVLDLSHNQIQDLPMDTFAQLEDLRHLDLSFNLLKEINLTLSSSTRLEYLDLSNNFLTSLPQVIIDELNEIALANKSRTLRVDIGSNGLICTCATKDFVQWVLATHPPNLVFVNSGEYYCTNRHSYSVVMTAVKISDLNLECYENVIYGCTGAGGAVFIVLLGWAYKRRFLLQHKLYKLTKKAAGRTYNQRQHRYDAFICYDTEDSDWIDFEAKKKLKGFAIAYGEEEIRLGQNVHEAVYQYITASRRSILVLSPDFVSSPNNMYHMRIAEEKLKNTGNDILVIVLLRPLNRVGLDQTLKELMERRLCLEWREDIQDAQNFFWERLTDVLRRPCDELYDMPLDDESAHHDVPQDEESAHPDISEDQENAHLIV